MARVRIAFLVGLAAVASTATAGCATRDEPGRIEVTAVWRTSQHLDVVATNVGRSPVSLTGVDMGLDGPRGSVPVHWNGMGPTLEPGESVAFDMHALSMPDGAVHLAMDHAVTGGHATMPHGAYTFRMGDARASATLA